MRFYKQQNNKILAPGLRAKEFTKELEWFYSESAEINPGTVKNIATDACPELKRIVKNVKNSKWFFSKLHAVRDVTAHYTGKLHLLGKAKKKVAGYYDFIMGSTEKMINFFKSKKQTLNIRKFLSKTKRNKEGIESWKTAKFGYSAESEVSKLKKLLNNGRNIYSPLTFARKLEANGYVVKM